MNGTTLTILILFALTYVFVFLFEKQRPLIACGSAFLFVILGSLGVLAGFDYSFSKALSEIDWNVILMILGIMGTVNLFIDSSMPQLMSDIIISKVPNVKWMTVIISLFAGIVSAFMDNVATVLMIAPVALAICKKLDISPVPIIICISVSSNLQGAATLVGDTTSILLAKAAQLDFTDFFFLDGKPGMFFVTELGAIVSTLIILFMFRKENGEVSINERAIIEDKFPTFLLILTIVSLILASFIPYKNAAAPGQFCKPDIANGLICMFFFIVGLVRKFIKNKDFKEITNAVKSLDYYTVFLLAGLFVVIGAVKEAGIIDLIAQLIFNLCGGGRLTVHSVFIAYTIIVWMSVLISAFIDNIPYVATMLPVVAVLTQSFSASELFVMNPYVMYFGLLVGATLGGNLTPVGASANITGIGILRREGLEVKSSTFMKYSVPFTLASVTTGYLLAWLIFKPLY